MRKDRFKKIGHFLISSSIGKYSFSDLNCFKNTHIFDLSEHKFRSRHVFLFLIRFDASDIVIGRFFKFICENIDLICKFFKKSSS